MKIGNGDRLTKVISAIVLTMLGSGNVFAAPGDLDPTFGGDGVVVTDIEADQDLGWALAIQVDGKLVVGGQARTASGNPFALVRYNPDGSLDTSFDGDGIVTTAVGPSTAVCRALVVQPDGKLVGLGIAWDQVSGSWDFALVRYHANGSLDTSFDGDGIVMSGISAGHDQPNALAVQPDGKLVAAGGSGGKFVLARYNADGSLDNTFSGDGIVTTALPSPLIGAANGLVVQSDGKLVVVGTAHPNIVGDSVIVLVRYNVDGSLDASFDGDGIVITDLFPGYDYAYALIVQPDGKLVAAGYTDDGIDEAMALVRYNPDGSLDTSFDGDGKVTTDIGTVEDRADALVVQPDGKLVAAGITDSVVSIVRYNGDGSLDTSFGGDGIVTTDIGGTAKAMDLAVQPDGKLVAAGWVSSQGFAASRNFFVARYEGDALDITPDGFGFSDENDVALDSLSTSDLVSVSGLGVGISVPVSVAGDGNSEYAINGNAYGTNPGWVLNGDQISVRHTSAATHNTANDTMLTVGGLHASNNSTVILGPISSDTYTSTTVVADTTPDAFSFNDQTDVPRSTILESNTITVTGINTGTGITISGGEYRLNGGSYTAVSGTVNGGDTVKLRHTSSAGFSASADTILIIGGVSDIFTSTTEPQPDITPDALIFNDQTDVALSTMVESNAITVSGINTGTSISISGGEYSLNGSSYTALAGAANDGDTVKVRHMTSNGFSTSTDTTLTIGGVSDTFTTTTTTLAADLVPDNFAFSDVTDVPPNILIESTPITVTGITAPSSIAITNGEYSVNGGSYTGLAGTVMNSDTIKVRHTSDTGFSSATDTTLMIGGISDTFTSTTLAGDTTLEPFSLNERVGVMPNTWVESDIITVTGINAPVAITVSNGEYSVNGGAYTSNVGSVGNGDTVKVRHTTSASFLTRTDSMLAVGGISATFTSTTQAADSDVIVSNASGSVGGGGGCTFTDSKAQDPTLPLLLLISIGYLVRRYPQA